jgi:hypothetical protein
MRSWLWTTKTLRTLRVPAGDPPEEKNALSTEDDEALLTESGETLTIEG